ncbi:MAG: hypothetical protein COZ46_06740 [Verrucomicrobia bacterium CG_4_10_14_3_um_filter_43_23]|nr:MAG: hypothetical protein COZ46_06740 [Verrucomicrobia bacterium CG_4_10_14_3_um_filter_43_23]
MNKSNNGNNSFKNFINKIPSLLTRKGSNSGNEGNLTPTNTKEDLGELGNKDFKHNNSFELYKKKKILKKEKYW